MRQYKSASAQSNPSISTGRKVLNILQNHYVERECCSLADRADADMAQVWAEDWLSTCRECLEPSASKAYGR